MEVQMMFVAPVGHVTRHNDYIRASVVLPMRRQETTVWATVFLHGTAERLDRMYPLMQHGGRLLVTGSLSQLMLYNGKPSVTVSARDWQFVPRHPDIDTGADTAPTDTADGTPKPVDIEEIQW